MGTMARFAQQPVRRGPATNLPGITFTHEGGLGARRDPKSELFLAVCSTLTTDAFYESADERLERIRQLVDQVIIGHADPDYVAKLIPWVRNVLNLRSVSVVLACAYVKSMSVGPRANATFSARQVVASACARPDEPAEVLAYWITTYGRNVPKPIKRGVADAVARLYNEAAVLRYDGTGKPWRFGDVIELVHPTPSAAWQRDLFRYCLDRRRHGEETPPDSLEQLTIDHNLQRVPVEARRDNLAYGAAAFASWERLSGWLPGGMDATAWEAVIPTMGYMALLRNLRNFDQAGIAVPYRQEVMARLSDPAQVAKSRQMPFRFYSAYSNMETEQWSGTLESALEESIRNVPTLSGRTLILVDSSGSMGGFWGYPRSTIRPTRSTISPAEQAAIFGVALAKRAEQADLVQYDTATYTVNYQRAPLLRLVREMQQHGGGGTLTMAALNRHYEGHDRVIILTDEQAHDAGSPIPNARIYTWVIGGYAPAMLAEGDHFTFGGGLSDACFTLLEQIEKQGHGEWPHLTYTK